MVFEWFLILIFYNGSMMVKFMGFLVRFSWDFRRGSVPFLVSSNIHGISTLGVASDLGTWGKHLGGAVGGCIGSGVSLYIPTYGSLNTHS